MMAVGCFGIIGTTLFFRSVFFVELSEVETKENILEK